NSLEQERLSLSNAQSQIIDADYSTESSSLTKNMIIQQAGTSVLAQANVSMSIALDLLN
ncbi:MAG: flagellin FliC, partial [Myxococcales bacterium]|nr:flagellin FliC [Myxococcales bacterium]